MLDRTSKKVLNIISRDIKGKDGRFLTFDYIYRTVKEELNISEIDAIGCVNYLHDEGYIEFSTLNGRAVGAYLAHKGNHPKEFSLISFMKYLSKNWIAIIALFISIIALLKK